MIRKKVEGKRVFIYENDNIIGMVFLDSDFIRISLFDAQDKCTVICSDKNGLWCITETRAKSINLHGRKKIEKLLLGIVLDYNINLPIKIKSEFVE